MDLNFTPEEKCTAIFNWAGQAKINFNTDFVESLHTQYLQKGRLTSNQENALDNIILRFKIDVAKWSY